MLRFSRKQNLRETLITIMLPDYSQSRRTNVLLKFPVSEPEQNLFKFKEISDFNGKRSFPKEYNY
ncbi:CBM_collapsed_G0025670.mRNA.1.CDS.1 [Saccharomyces cerevisiae]|nr:CBM_collapsed_G0025670.mRNA.1.CDS.1 [Saccharomyces cerevisiae]